MNCRSWSVVQQCRPCVAAKNCRAWIVVQQCRPGVAAKNCRAWIVVQQYRSGVAAKNCRAWIVVQQYRPEVAAQNCRAWIVVQKLLDLGLELLQQSGSLFSSIDLNGLLFRCKYFRVVDQQCRTVILDIVLVRPKQIKVCYKRCLLLSRDRIQRKLYRNLLSCNQVFFLTAFDTSVFGVLSLSIS